VVLILAVVVLVVGISFVVAAVVVGREARRLGAQRKRPIYRLEDAVDHVADRLPFEVAAQLTHEDVRTLLRWHLNALQFEDGAILAIADDPGGLLVVSDRDAVAALARRARAELPDVTTPQIQAVVECHLDYLVAIGAIDDV
jgi:hypothetical protein